MTTMDNNTQTPERKMHIAFKGYNLLLIVIDLAYLVIRWTKVTLHSIYRLIVPAPELPVTGETVLVTGAGHGIGKEIALKYARLGANVICVDINDVTNQETCQIIKSNGGNAYSYQCDISKRDKVLELSQSIRNDIGYVSILINNAGIMPTHPVLQQTESEIRRTFDINVISHFWLIQAFLPGMIEKNHGHIVAMSSIAGLCGLRNLVPYCSTKFAVRGLMEAMEEEIRNDARRLQIKFTTIYPYMTDTGLCKLPHTRFVNLMKLLKPSQVADAVVSAQRKQISNVTIPIILQYTEAYARLFPHECGQLLADFLDSGVESDL